jgi:4-oxalocrotonate tautomerase
MPHVIVKLYPGRPAETLKKLADKIVSDVTAIAGCEEKSVSIAIEEVDPSDWPDEVYRPDILENASSLIVKPGYNPFDK